VGLSRIELLDFEEKSSTKKSVVETWIELPLFEKPSHPEFPDD